MQGSLPALASGGSQQQQQPAQQSHITSSSSTYRSKFAGMPGSASALHLHYGFKNSAPAFDPLPPTHPAAQARRDAQRWAQGQRLGQKPEWDGTSATADSGGHPRRALMHQLSEFQAPRIVFNFRAQHVPQVHKKSVPVWRPSKFRVDQTAFLSKADRGLATHSVEGTTTLLSHAEMPITDDPRLQRREAAWNQSTALEPVRANLFAKKEYEDLRPLNKTKPILDHDRYVNPVEDVRRRQEEARDIKRQARQEHEEFVAQMKREARARRGMRPQSLSIQQQQQHQVGPDGKALVFKMSNMETWIKHEPAELREAVSVLETRRRDEEARAALKAQQEAEARGAVPQGLRVVAPGQSQGAKKPAADDGLGQNVMGGGGPTSLGSAR
jgi:hypothetical protein